MRYRNILFSVTFLIFIFVFPASFYILNQVVFVNGEISNIDIGEKRKKSEFNINDSIDNLGKNIELFYNDRIPYRNFLILADRIVNGNINAMIKYMPLESDKLSAELEVEPFVDNYPLICSDNNFVIFGQSNWLFYNDPHIMEIYTKDIVKNDSYFEQVSDEIKMINEIAKEKGVEIYYMIAPDKQEVYEEYMPSIPIKENELNFSERLVKYIKENVGVQIIYPRELLKSYKNKYRMYKKYDSHWNKISAYLATNEIYKQMGTKLPELKKVNVKKIDEYVSTVNGDCSPSESDLVLLSNKIFTEFPSAFEYDIQYEGGKNKDIDTSKALCLIGDSFSLDMQLDVLFKDFKNISFVHGVDDLPKGKLVDSITDSDVIIYELVERNIVDNFLINLQYIKKALLKKK